MNLQVVVPEAFILGSGELHVDMGSTINLVCIIEKVSVRDSVVNFFAIEMRQPNDVLASIENVRATKVFVEPFCRATA